jgi:hypothetical protein
MAAFGLLSHNRSTDNLGSMTYFEYNTDLMGCPLWGLQVADERSGQMQTASQVDSPCHEVMMMYQCIHMKS